MILIREDVLFVTRHRAVDHETVGNWGRPQLCLSQFQQTPDKTAPDGRHGSTYRLLVCFTFHQVHTSVAHLSSQLAQPFDAGLVKDVTDQVETAVCLVADADGEVRSSHRALAPDDRPVDNVMAQRAQHGFMYRII